jgi:small subunit ribosomal protein S1
MNLDLRVVEVDPIHRRIVLTVVAIPEDQPPRPETPPKIHTEDSDAEIPEVPPGDLDLDSPDA